MRSKDSDRTTRRDFLVKGTAGLATFAAGSWLLPACGAPQLIDDVGTPVQDGAADALSSDGADPNGSLDGSRTEPVDAARPYQHLDATPQCIDTDDNIEGPFYKPGAPFRTALADPAMAGTKLTVSGRVLSERCAPLAGALLDVWQANDAGQYDNVGFILREKLYTDADGNYQVQTIVPGRYLNGPTYRPSHIHVKASAPGFATLTTQLYFAGDPFNASDAFIKPSLIMAITDVGDGSKRASFDFVLMAANG